MNRNFLIIGGLIIVLVIGASMILAFGDFSTDLIDDNSNSYPIEEELDSDNSTYPIEELYVTFDSSTPEATAESIARLNEGMTGFYTHHKLNASLTSDGKYWIVNMDDWIVTVDAKTLMSKKDGGYWGPKNKWRSFDELKARYIAEIQTKANEIVGEPSKIVIDDKEIWKIPVYGEFFDGQETYFWEAPHSYIYVDVATGKSKRIDNNFFYRIHSYFFNDSPGTDGWKTLKEVADTVDIIKGNPETSQPFRNALGNLYKK